MNRRILWITRTAITTALLIVLQAATASLGQLVTGSLVNLMLIVGVMIGGLYSGLTVAVLSPIMAKLLGIGPLWELIPFIILGNLVLVLCWHLLANRHYAAQTLVHAVAAVIAACLKCLTLYLGIVQVAIPFLLNLQALQATAISAMFSIPQLFTALIGGGVAILILPLLKKALKSEG
jgi:hypothetical protein